MSDLLSMTRKEQISIHAPHEGERPAEWAGFKTVGQCISIHAPHEGERQFIARAVADRRKFQSTLPTRGSDGIAQMAIQVCDNFNPRSPRGGATDLLGGG